MKGFTLLELVIGASLLAVIIGGAIAVYSTALDTYHTGDAIIHAQMMIQIKMDQMVAELEETSEQNLTLYSWVDPKLGAGLQEAICFSSARDQAGNFITLNGQPQWQSVVVYAPYTNPNHDNIGEIKRYEDFGIHNFPITIEDITETEIILSDDTRFLRSSGSAILSDLSTLDAQALRVTTLNPLSLEIQMTVKLPKGHQVNISLQTYVSCRN